MNPTSKRIYVTTSLSTLSIRLELYHLHSSILCSSPQSSIGSIRNSVRQRLTVLSLSGDAVGFVTVTSWAGGGGGGHSSAATAAMGLKTGEYSSGGGNSHAYSTPTHTQVIEHKR